MGIHPPPFQKSNDPSLIQWFNFKTANVQKCKRTKAKLKKAKLKKTNLKK